jgi:hypothetical protein
MNDRVPKKSFFSYEAKERMGKDNQILKGNRWCKPIRLHLLKAVRPVKPVNEA